MLRLSNEYIGLLHHARNRLAHQHEQLIPPLPIEPFRFCIVGRLSTLQLASAREDLLRQIRAMCVKTAIRKCQGQRAGGRQHDLDAVAVAAENPPWLQEVDQQSAGQPLSCRYLLIEDLLHANSISRFHFLIKREAFIAGAIAANPPAAAESQDSESHSRSAMSTISIDDATMRDAASVDPSVRGAPHAAGAAAGGAHPFPFKYFIKDLGSLNGVYLDGVRVPEQVWTQIPEGARVRFAPITRNAKSYSQAFAAAEARWRAARSTEFRPFVAAPPAPTFAYKDVPAAQLPGEPVELKDLHIEFVFSHTMADDARARIDKLDEPPLRRRLDGSIEPQQLIAPPLSASPPAPLVPLQAIEPLLRHRAVLHPPRPAAAAASAALAADSRARVASAVEAATAATAAVAAALDRQGIHFPSYPADAMPFAYVAAARDRARHVTFGQVAQMESDAPPVAAALAERFPRGALRRSAMPGPSRMAFPSGLGGLDPIEAGIEALRREQAAQLMEEPVMRDQAAIEGVISPFGAEWLASVRRQERRQVMEATGSDAEMAEEDQPMLQASAPVGRPAHPTAAAAAASSAAAAASSNHSKRSAADANLDEPDSKRTRTNSGAMVPAGAASAAAAAASSSPSALAAAAAAAPSSSPPSAPASSSRGPASAGRGSSRKGKRTAWHFYVSTNQRLVQEELFALRRSQNLVLPNQVDENKAVFALAAKEIASRWKALPKEEVAKYQNMAEAYNRGETVPSGLPAPPAVAAPAAAAAAAAAPSTLSSVAVHLSNAPAAAAAASSSSPPMDIFDDLYEPSISHQRARSAQRRRAQPMSVVPQSGSEEEPMPDAAAAPAMLRRRSEEADFALAQALQEQEDKHAANSRYATAETKDNREIHTISDDDEDVPILMTAARSSHRAAAAAASSSAAAAAAPSLTPSSSSSSPAASLSLTPHPPAAEKNEALHSMLAEFECGICADVIIGSVVLDCGHSYCKHCIDQWFRKKKICPVCRARHKGVPLAVRTMDKAIAIMTEQLYTPEQKAERQERIVAIQQTEQERTKQDAVRLRQAVERRQSRMALLMQRGPADIMQRALLQHAGVRQRLQQRVRNGVGARPGEPIEIDDDEDYLDFDADEYDDAYAVGDADDEVLIRASVRRALPPPPPRPTYAVDLVTERRTVCRSCCAIIEPGLLRLVQRPGVRPGDQPPAGDVGRAHFHLSCFVHDQAQPRLTLAQLEQYNGLSAELRDVVQTLVPV
jgi:hypothetical protein